MYKQSRTHQSSRENQIFYFKVKQKHSKGFFAQIVVYLIVL